MKNVIWGEVGRRNVNGNEDVMMWLTVSPRRARDTKSSKSGGCIFFELLIS